MRGGDATGTSQAGLQEAIKGSLAQLRQAAPRHALSGCLEEVRRIGTDWPHRIGLLMLPFSVELFLKAFCE